MFSDFVSAVRHLRERPPETREHEAAVCLRIAFLGNCTLDHLRDAVELELAPRIFCHTYLGPFGQWPQEVLDERSRLAEFKPDIVVLYLSSLGMTSGGSRLDPVPAADLENALRTFGRRSSARLVVVLPEPLAECSGGDSDADAWYRDGVQKVATIVRDSLPGRCAILDPAATLATFAKGWAAAGYWTSAKIPLHPIAVVTIGRRLARMIENISSARIKVVAVDCDDTLWGGLAGEVDPQELQLSPHDGGAAYLRLQRVLKEAARRGILLVAVSKNEPATVEAVFKTRPEMVLSANDFALMKVSWGPKSQAIQEAAKELNLGLDSVLFLDDSAFERGEVQAALPDVTVIDLPSNPEERAAFVVQTGLLERPILTDEDLRRTELYREERLRTESRSAAATINEYLSSLDLRLTPVAFAPENLARVAQLIAKTNQFNLTTRRYSHQQLAELAADPNVYTHAFRVADRFGDAGLIGAIILQPEEEGVARLDIFLMSCRVMGRTVENAMFNHALRWLRERGYETIRGEYLPTARNGMVAGLLSAFGFTLESGENGHERYTRSTESSVDDPYVVSTDDVVGVG